MNFLLTLLPKLLSLLEEKKGSKGVGRNTARLVSAGGTAITIAMLSAISSDVHKTVEQIASMDRRLVRVETRLSLSDTQPQTPDPIPETLSVSNRFAHLHKGYDQ